MGRQNNLQLNHTKTKEMIIRKRGTTKLVAAIIAFALRVESLCILRVTISSDLNMDQHINRVLSSASFHHHCTPSARFDQRNYLQTLSTSSPKPPRCPAPCTHPLAWWGFASTQSRDKIEALISRMKRRGFLHPEHPSADFWLIW